MKESKKLIALILAAACGLTLTGCFGGSIGDMASGIYLREGDDLCCYISFDDTANEWRSGMIPMNAAISGSFTVNWRRIVLSWRGGNRIVLRAAKDGALEVLSAQAEGDELFSSLGIKPGDRFVKTSRFDEQPEGFFDELLPADEALAYARGAQYPVFENGVCTFGKDKWRAFFSAVSAGSPASIKTAKYYTLNEEQVDPDYYKEIKDDYPILFWSYIEYDGSSFTVTVRDSSNEEIDSKESYKYMLHFIGENAKNARWRYHDSYMLVDDPEATYEGIWAGIFSSQSGAGYKHHEAYSDRFDKAPLSFRPYEEQLEFLKNAGVDFPDNFKAEDHADFIADVIRRTETDPNYAPVLSNPVAIKVAGEISRAVNGYYGFPCGDD